MFLNSHNFAFAKEKAEISACNFSLGDIDCDVYKLIYVITPTKHNAVTVNYS